MAAEDYRVELTRSMPDNVEPHTSEFSLQDPIGNELGVGYVSVGHGILRYDVGQPTDSTTGKNSGPRIQAETIYSVDNQPNNEQHAKVLKGLAAVLNTLVSEQQ